MSLAQSESRNNRKYVSGPYTPKNPEKYIGTKIPVYKSSYEWRMMYWCDLNTNVLKWSYEPFPIEYTFQVPDTAPDWMKSLVDYKVHRYYVDFYARIVDNDGRVKDYMLEIKPYNQTVIPKEPKRKTKKTLKQFYISMCEFIKNSNKWAAAREKFNKQGIDFQVLTERNLFS